jgi:putative membrane protein
MSEISRTRARLTPAGRASCTLAPKPLAPTGPKSDEAIFRGRRIVQLDAPFPCQKTNDPSRVKQEQIEMKRLLASTALALLVAGPLAAQQATDGAATSNAPAAGAASDASGSPGGLFLPANPDAIYASDLIGMDVYSSATDYATEYGNNQPATADARSKWDDIGEINDVVLSAGGDVQGVLVDIGGFLGMGARTVALDMSKMHFLRDESGTRFAAVTSSREALEAAPEYQRQEQRESGVRPLTGEAATAAMAVTEPQAFAEAAASSNMFEIESSKLALERATADDVRAFAQQMIDDHTAAGEKMKAAAESDGLTPPTAMKEKEQADLAQIQSAEGDAFDQAYVTAQVAAHDQAVALFESFSNQGSDSALREFAAATLPTLQEHQSAVRELAGSH